MIVKFLLYVLHMYCTILNFYIAGGEKKKCTTKRTVFREMYYCDYCDKFEYIIYIIFLGSYSSNYECIWM